MIQDHKVTIFYTAPTAIRSLMGGRATRPCIRELRPVPLRLLGSVGEPINPAAWGVVLHERRRRPLPDRRHLVADRDRRPHDHPLPGATPLVPALRCPSGHHGRRVSTRPAPTCPGAGRHPGGQRPWPSMIRTIWGDPGPFQKTYYPEPTSRANSTSPATARSDKETGYFTITGRIDDVLNVSGHPHGHDGNRVALVANEKVAEAAVVGRPDDLTGEAIVAFVVLKGARPTGDEAAAMIKELQNWVARDRPDRQAEGHPFRREPAQDPFRQDHAACCVPSSPGRGCLAGHLDAREPAHPRTALGLMQCRPGPASAFRTTGGSRPASPVPGRTGYAQGVPDRSSRRRATKNGAVLGACARLPWLVSWEDRMRKGCGQRLVAVFIAGLRVAQLSPHCPCSTGPSDRLPAIAAPTSICSPVGRADPGRGVDRRARGALMRRSGCSRAG